MKPENSFKAYFWLGNKCEVTQEATLKEIMSLVDIAKQNPKIEYKIIEIEKISYGGD